MTIKLSTPKLEMVTYACKQAEFSIVSKTTTFRVFISVFQVETLGKDLSEWWIVECQIFLKQLTQKLSEKDNERHSVFPLNFL